RGVGRSARAVAEEAAEAAGKLTAGSTPAGMAETVAPPSTSPSFWRPCVGPAGRGRSPNASGRGLRDRDVHGTIARVNNTRVPQISDLSQHEVLAGIDELIREVATGGNRGWENPELERYLEAMWAWLNGRPEPPPESLERRMIGHILSPPGVTSLADY